MSDVPPSDASQEAAPAAQEPKRITSAPGMLKFSIGNLAEIAQNLSLRVSEVAAVGTNPAHPSGLSDEVRKPVQPGKGHGIV